MLDRLARRLAELPLLVVGTYRSDELYPRVPMRGLADPAAHPAASRGGAAAPARPADTAAMVAAIPGAALPSAVAGALFARSDGIPLHIEEFLATVGDGVPDTLADAVLARAEQLSARPRELAGAARCIGRSFDLDLLAAVTGEPPRRVDRGLRELADRFFVSRAPTGRRTTSGTR